MDQYRVSEVFCGINEFNSFPPSTQIQKGQKECHHLLINPTPTIKGLFKLLGHLTSSIQAVFPVKE